MRMALLWLWGCAGGERRKRGMDCEVAVFWEQTKAALGLSLMKIVAQFWRLGFNR